MDAKRARGWILIGLLLLPGCAQKLTYERWETIHQGETQDAVKATLGDPVEKQDVRWMYMDADRGITADIYFQECKVIGKTWCDPDRGMVGKSPFVNQPGDAEERRYQKIK